MKKKRILAVVCLLGIITIYSQDTEVKLPEQTPPSPEAFAITKYGGIPINESTGKATFNVPIYTYKAGNLSLPISLNYMGNGVKIDAPSTWTGVNWTLNAGGVITRTVNHKPDELATQRIFREELEALNLFGLSNELDVTFSNTTGDATVLFNYYNMRSNMWDTQPDIFNFSFSGYSGSFYLDKTFNPVLIKEDLDIKIEIVGTQSTPKERLAQTKHFIITTPDGIKYHFGANAIEQTSKEHSGHNITTPYAITSYLLYQIEHPLNGILLLEYSDYVSKIGLSQFQSWNRYNQPPSLKDLRIPFPEVQTRMSGESPSSAIPIIVYNHIQGKYLTKIHSPNSPLEVLFNQNSATTGGVNGRFNFSSVLHNIEVKNNTNSILKADFSYLFNYEGDIAQRFFLTKVRFNQEQDTNSSNLGRKYQEYQFAYKNATDLPKRFSYSQDHLGYYNAEDNAGLFPQSDNHLFSAAIAKRDSDFETRSTGVLTKITYPTGGFTKIEYEAPLEVWEYTKNVNLTTYANDFDNHIDVLLDTYSGLGLYLNEDGTVQNENGAFKTQTVNIQVTIASEATLLLHHDNLISVEITDTTDMANPIVTTQNVVVVSPDSYTDIINGNYIYTYMVPFTITEAHRYSVKLKLNPTSSFTTKLQAKLKFTYIKGAQLRDGEGIRVKRVSDYAKQYESPTVLSSPENIKRYYYTKIENLSKPLLAYLPSYRKPNYFTSGELLVKVEGDIGTPGTPIIVDCKIYGHTATSLDITPNNYPDVVTYKDVVISYGGDNFENGGISKTFYLNRDWDGDHIEDALDGYIENEDNKGEDFLPVKIINRPWIETFSYKSLEKQFKYSDWSSSQSGIQLQKNTFKKENNILYKIEQIDYDTDYRATNFRGFIGSGVENCNVHYRKYLYFGLGVYNILSRKIKNSTTITKKFIDPYPMEENVMGELPDEANYKKIITTQTIQYNSAYKGLPTQTKVTSNMPDRNVLIKNKYLDQMGELNGINTQQIAAYTALEDKHNIAQPIHVEKYIETGKEAYTLLSTKRTIYKITPEGKVVPEKVQTAKGINLLEDRIAFTEYDMHGNLTEVSLKEGSKVRYAYNNRGQVIRKIENYEAPITGTGGEISEDVDTVGYTGNCFRTVQYPNSLVTTYQYDNTTHLLTSITSPRCETTYYEYDAFLRLHYIKDNEGNILKENETNYRR